MKVFAKTISGNTTISLDVKPTDIIENVKTKIQEEAGIPSNIQRLFLGGEKDGEELKDENTLSNYCLCTMFHHGFILRFYNGNHKYLHRVISCI